LLYIQTFGMHPHVIAYSSPGDEIDIISYNGDFLPRLLYHTLLCKNDINDDHQLAFNIMLYK
jgi:hypothetical protein